MYIKFSKNISMNSADNTWCSSSRSDYYDEYAYIQIFQPSLLPLFEYKENT